MYPNQGFETLQSCYWLRKKRIFYAEHLVSGILSYRWAGPPNFQNAKWELFFWRMCRKPWDLRPKLIEGRSFTSAADDLWSLMTRKYQLSKKGEKFFHFWPWKYYFANRQLASRFHLEFANNLQTFFSFSPFFTLSRPMCRVQVNPRPGSCDTSIFLSKKKQN